MNYTSITFKEEINRLYNNEVLVTSEYRGLNKKVFTTDKYGDCILSARSLLQSRPGLKSAINKTAYFMNILKHQQHNIWKDLKVVSEYSGMNKDMLFEDKFGLISVYPVNLITGHKPNIRSAVDQNLYFKNMLKYIYKGKYDFEITNCSRHNGKSILICEKHGRVKIDNDYIFCGSGCPSCSVIKKSDLLYIVKLSSDNESFYKLGISSKDKSDITIRYRSYKSLGYKIEVIKEVLFKTSDNAKYIELELKRLIRNNLYKPLNWEYETSTECFSLNMFDCVFEYVNNLSYDIVCSHR